MTATALGNLRVGMHVRTTRWDRPLRPHETGHPRDVSLGRGCHGVVTGFARRTSSGLTFDVVIVRWDAQTWHEWVPPFQRMTPGRAYDSSEIARMYDEGPEVDQRQLELPVDDNYSCRSSPGKFDLVG